MVLLAGQGELMAWMPPRLNRDCSNVVDSWVMVGSACRKAWAWRSRLIPIQMSAGRAVVQSAHHSERREL